MIMTNEAGAAIGTATNPLVVSGTTVMTVTTVANSVAAASAASGGIALNGRLVSSTASTNATLVKASAGRVYRLTAFNTSAAVKFLKLYNKATAPVPGTDTPVWTEALAVGRTDLSFDGVGYTFATGIGFALTGAAADADTTALAAGDVVALNIGYA
jgi:hypothetical protein